MNYRRSRLEIKVDVLKNCIKSISTYKLVSKVNVSWEVFKKESRFLLDKGLIRSFKIKDDRRKFYILTEFGYDILTLWNKLESILGNEWEKDLENRFKKMENQSQSLKKGGRGR